MMYDSKALFDYWHDQVRLRNQELISAPGHIQTQTLRHECTNYDDLRLGREVQLLDEPERSKIIAIIKYECTAQVLQHRAGRLRDRAYELEDACKELDRKQSKLLSIVRALQEKLFGKDQAIKKLEARIDGLKSENEALRAESETDKAQAELLAELEQLKKQYAALEQHRQKLAKNNQSLGGRVSHTERYKKQRDGAIAEVKELKQQLTNLAGENQQIRQENERLHSELEKHQKRAKLGIVEIKTNETR